MKIAIEGCAHGELEKIYESIKFIENKESYKVDLLICCGDFQSTRNRNDLECMAIPRKFHDMCSFYKYYSGEKIAPILTIFIGGNHEASNYLQELPYGGWVAQNIYYLGYAGVINIAGLRIGGISGIFKGHDFFRGRHEFSPYSESTKRSVYHTRQIDVFRLKQLTGNIVIFLSHDWPRGIHKYGDTEKLLRQKSFFRNDIENNELGSPPCEDLLKTLKPSYWFSAHLHCKFSALVEHDLLDKQTKFLALDKCLPKRQFLQILDIDSSSDSKSNLEINYDLEWLTILHLTNHLISVKNCPHYMPGKEGEERFNFSPSSTEKQSVMEKFDGNLKVPNNFVKTSESYDPTDKRNTHHHSFQTKSVINPQTFDFCEKLGIDDPLSLAMMLAGEELNHSTIIEDNDSFTELDTSSCLSQNDSFINESPIKIIAPLASTLPKPKQEFDTNTDEIKLDDEVKLENCDNKWIEDRTPDSSINLSYDNAETTIFELTSSESVNSVLLNTTENRPVKKFKRRNESIYNTCED